MTRKEVHVLEVNSIELYPGVSFVTVADDDGEGSSHTVNVPVRPDQNLWLDPDSHTLFDAYGNDITVFVLSRKFLAGKITSCEPVQNVPNAWIIDVLCGNDEFAFLFSNLERPVGALVWVNPDTEEVYNAARKRVAFRRLAGTLPPIRQDA